MYFKLLEPVTCPKCEGRGILAPTYGVGNGDNVKCDECHGVGYVMIPKKIEV